MQRDQKGIVTYIGALSLLILGCGASSLSSPVVGSTATARAAPTEAIDIPNASVVYYDISGSTPDELRAQLDALGPLAFNGYKGDATTNWYIHWNWPGYGTSSCDLGSATISYDIQVILPRWIPEGDVPPELVSKWSNYVHLLTAHEQGHVDYVTGNFQAVADAIKGSSCDSADAVGTLMLERLRQHDLDYDAETQHGITQGAIFP